MPLGNRWTFFGHMAIAYFNSSQVYRTRLGSRFRTRRHGYWARKPGFVLLHEKPAASSILEPQRKARLVEGSLVKTSGAAAAARSSTLEASVRYQSIECIAVLGLLSVRSFFSSTLVAHSYPTVIFVLVLGYAEHVRWEMRRRHPLEPSGVTT
jgi:hypothetical protein